MLKYSQIIKISKMFIGPDEVPSTADNKSMYDHIDLDDDLHWNYTLMDFPSSEFVMSSDDQFDFSKPLEQRDQSPESQIRHHDCMWSGRCTTHPEKCTSNNNIKQKQTEAGNKRVSSATSNITTLATTTTTSTTTTATTIAAAASTPITPTTTPTTMDQNSTSIPPLQQLQQHTIYAQIQKKTETIPAGRSLLINSRLNQPKPITTIIKLPTLTTNDFLKDREFVIARPDTPLSLDDDPPEFKHSIDLAACTMGSNKMSLIPDNETSTDIINMLKEHLEDESSNQMHIRNRFHTFLPDTKNESLTDLLKDIKCLSDFEDLEEDEDDSGADEADSDMESTSGSGSNNGTNTAQVSSQSSTSAYDFNQTMHSDHSYTRSKNRVDVIGLGVQTPSDSEEEIDVVSVGDKTLPTNPTAKDRRALQTTVAHKISVGIVKPPGSGSSSSSSASGGIKTILPRRHCSDDDSSEGTLTPPITASNTSPSSPKYSSSIGSYGGDYHHVSRKRQRDADRNSNGSGSKRFRGKKQRSSPLKRQPTDDTADETDTIEKRNLHNDMERQRRIGLKNLFEELKYQIPSLKDKERAPKVSILREASNLCRKYQREEEEKKQLKNMQAKLYNRVSVLRTALAAQRSKYMD